jgi:hypothetical protein
MTGNDGNNLEANVVLEAYRTIFNTPAGEIVIKDLCKLGFLFRPTIVHGNDQETFMHEGARQLVLLILKKAKVTPNQIIQDYDRFYSNNPI